MLKQRKAPGGQPGAHTDLTPRRGGYLVMPYYRGSSPPCQELSRLIGQANCLSEKYEAQAWRSWRLAQKHRRIKQALERLAEVRA